MARQPDHADVMHEVLAAELGADAALLGDKMEEDMRSLLVYYSFSGNTDHVAKLLAGELKKKGEVDIQRLRVLPVDPVADAAQPGEVAQVLRRGGSACHRRDRATDGRMERTARARSTLVPIRRRRTPRGARR